MCAGVLNSTGETAEAKWIYDKDAGGNTCVPDSEPGLKVSRNTSFIMMAGTGQNPDFYSFSADLSADGTEMNGNILQGQTPQGTFSAKKGGAPVFKKCIPKPRPPPPPPPPPPTPTTHAFIWPLPTKYTNGSTSLAVDASAGVGFFSGPASSKLLAAAFERYARLTFPHKVPATDDASASSLSGLTVTVDSTAEDFPQIETDESYELTVPDAGGKASLHAKTVFGALRGLETFSQIVVFDFDLEAYTIPFAPWSITDTPRFPHRGLMFDSARHFEPIATIKALIDSLPYAKLNVLHWHMSDSRKQFHSSCFAAPVSHWRYPTVRHLQSFIPFPFLFGAESFPFEVTGKGKNLWKGAYSDQEKFTQLDVAGVVEYARLRGVRVCVYPRMVGVDNFALEFALTQLNGVCAW